MKSVEQHILEKLQGKELKEEMLFEWSEGIYVGPNFDYKASLFIRGVEYQIVQICYSDDDNEWVDTLHIAKR